MDHQHSFAQQMRQDAALFERRGLKDTAALIRSYADELDAYEENYDNEILTLDQAAAESGYTKGHLALLISQERLPNAGKGGAPRVRRRDLPKKPRSAPLSPTSASGPQLVQAALAEQGIPPNEV